MIKHSNKEHGKHVLKDSQYIDSLNTNLKEGDTLRKKFKLVEC